MIGLPKARVYGHTALPPVPVFPWPPAKRAPLPPFPPGQYDHVLPVNQHIPAGPDKRWIRANWWSVEVPGLPWLPGQSSEHLEMSLSYTMYQQAPAWWETILDQHVRRGLTHFMISWPNARADGWDVPRFVDHARVVKARIPFVHVMLAAKAADPRDAGWDVMEGRIAPVLDALMTAKTVDLVSLWETDLWQGAKLQSNIDGIAKLCGTDVDQWLHFSTERTWWGDYPNRTAFWAAQRGKVVGLLYQGDQTWDMGLRQARMRDTTDNRNAAPLFADGTFLFCGCEFDGMNIYDRSFSEDLGELRSYLHCCTNGLAPVRGYCAGGRRPDGSAL